MLEDLILPPAIDTVSTMTDGATARKLKAIPLKQYCHNVTKENHFSLQMNEALTVIKTSNMSQTD